MKKYYFLLFISMFLALIPVGYAAKKNSQSLDSIVAVVNDGVITSSQLTNTLQLTKKQMAAAHVPVPQESALRKQVLDQLINKELQFQIAKQAKVTTTVAEVDRVIGNIAKDNKMPLKELYRQVGLQGMTVAEYRKEIQSQITLQKVQQGSIGHKILISPDEVTRFMHSKQWQSFNTKEYHLEDILIALPETPSNQDIAHAKNRAESLLTKIRSGQIDFKKAASSESGERNTLQVGDLGWRKLSEIPTAFTDRLTNMNPNDIAGPIQTPNGFHIVRLAGARSIAKNPGSNERKQVEQLLFQRKAEEALQTWLTKLRSEAFIKIET